jgi:hypothetical protein
MASQEVHLTGSHIMFHGLPHPTIRAAFDHLRAIAAACAGEAAVADWGLVTDPWAWWDHGARNCHIQSEAESSLALAATTRVHTPPRISLAHALADHCERRWRGMPVLSPELAILDPRYTTKWLLEQRLTSDLQTTLAIATEMTGRLRQQRDLVTDPASFFQRIPASEARTLLAAPLHRFLSTSQSGGGVHSLVDGWGDPDESGCRLQGAIGRLHLLPPREASVLRCRSLAAPTPEVAIFVDGTPLPTSTANDGRTLHIPLPQTSTVEDRIVTVEFVQKVEVGVQFGISGFDLSIAPGSSETAVRAPEVAQQVCSKSDGQKNDAAWLQAMIEERGIETLLLLAPDANIALANLHLDLSAVRVTAFSIVAGISTEADAMENISSTPSPHSPGLPVGSERFDLVHLYDMAAVPNLADRLPWLASQLNYRGILSGCERSAQQTRDVVSALGRGIDRRFLTVLLDGPRWRAIPHAHGRA